MATDAVVNAVFDDVIARLKQQSRVSRYYDDPVLFAEDVLGIKLWSKQRELVDLVKENSHTVVTSAHGTGKSLTSSVLACWWVATRPIGEAIAIWTAPTYAQVNAILGEEIRKHHAHAEQRYKEGLSPIKLPGYVTQANQWKTDDGKILLGFGRKPADTADNAFQGIHRRHVLVILDEACGIPESLWTGAEAITTTAGSRILAVGNPDDPASHFRKIFYDDPNWAKLKISAFDSPNFTVNHIGHDHGCDDERCREDHYAERAALDLDIPEDLRPLLIQHDWVEQRRLAWGEDSPLWVSKVLGEFPLQSVNTLFNLATLNRGADTEIKPVRTDPVILGVDLSRFGPNYSAVYKYEGGNLRQIGKWGGKADEQGIDGMESAAKVHALAQSYGASEVRVDSEGVGGPILDRIVQLAGDSYRVIAMRGSQTSPDTLRWINSRAFWYDKMREAMMNGLIDVDPKDKQLREELEQIAYHFNNRFKSLQIEAKEDMERRGLKSPDLADAAAYACADMSYVTDHPLGQFKPGDRISMDALEFLDIARVGTVSPY